MSSLVSCFLPVFNAAKFLPHWWEKNGAQLISIGAELIIVDNGSTDKTIEEIRKFDYPKTKLIEHCENLGIESSFLSAKSHIRSKYRILLPADDWLAPGYLGDALDLLESDAKVGVVYGNSYMVDLLTGSVTKRRAPARPRGPHREHPCFSFAFNNSIPDISLYRSSALDTNSSSWKWFLPGDQSSVLREFDTYFTGNDQCFSGKSPYQLSKSWAKSGYYYSFFCDRFSGYATFFDISLADQLLQQILNFNLHSNRSFSEIVKDIADSRSYANIALEIEKYAVFSNLCLLLIDDLFSDQSKKSINEVGQFGKVEDFFWFFGHLDSDSIEFVKRELKRRELSYVLS